MLKTTTLAALVLATPTFAHANPAGGFDVMSLLPIVMIFVVFYFLLLRPQQKKAKAHQEMVQNLRRGDRVVTSGGIIATVSKIMSDSEVIVEVEDGVKLRVLKGTISEVMTKSEPVATGEVAHFPKVVEKSEKKAPVKAAAKSSAKAPVKKTAAKPTAKKGK